MLKKIFNRLLHFSCLFIKVNWFKLITLHSKNSNNIIWIYQSFPFNFYYYFSGNCFLNDLAIIQSFISENQRFRIKIGPSIGEISKKNIYYTISKEFNIYNVTNHSSTMINIVEQLTNQENNLFPSLDEVKYWENKSYMHRMFEKLNIHCPKTWIINSNCVLNNVNNDLEYPCLLKECNSSGSAGIFKVNNFSELDNLIKKKSKDGEYEFLVQSLISMRRDLRVIFVGNKIEHYYWRINKAKEWKPTSTSFGSKVDFDYFPDLLYDEVLKIITKLNLRTGAFDICWKDDNTNNPAIILEVSPAYQPNPNLPNKWKNIKYSEYKNKLTFIKSYYTEYINIVFKLKHKLVKLYIKEQNNLNN